MHLIVTQHMKQRKLCMLNHFAHVGIINITSAFVVMVLLLGLFIAAHFKNDCTENWVCS